MEDKDNSEIPDFDALEMERGAFPIGSPLLPEIGRLRRPEPKPKLSLQLSIPLTSEELRHLCDVASSLGMDVEEVIREATLSFIGTQEPRIKPLPQKPKRVRRPPKTVSSQKRRTRTAEIEDSQIMTLPEDSSATKEIKAIEEALAKLEPYQETGVEMATRMRKGTGNLVSTDEREIIITADYTLWEKAWTAQTDGGWWGELVMMSAIPLDEYVIQLGEGDGRTGKIVLSDMEETAESEVKAYRYKFQGIGALINEWEELR